MGRLSVAAAGWSAVVASSAVWRDAMPATARGEPGAHATVTLALEGGRAGAELAARKAWVLDAAGKEHAVGAPAGPVAVKPGEKRQVELALEGVPPLAVGSSARVRVELADARGEARVVEGRAVTVQRVD